MVYRALSAWDVLPHPTITVADEACFKTVMGLFVRGEFLPRARGRGTVVLLYATTLGYSAMPQIAATDVLGIPGTQHVDGCAVELTWAQRVE